MDNSPNQPATKPKFSRWVIAGIIFSLIFIGFLCATICLRKINNYARKPRHYVGNLYLACKQYEAFYGRLPAVDGPVRDYDRLIAILANQSPENTKKLTFLVPNTGKDGRPICKDPWGSDFMVILSSSSTIQVGTGGIGETVYNNVAVWSKGPNRIDDHGSGDDIASWK